MKMSVVALALAAAGCQCEKKKPLAIDDQRAPGRPFPALAAAQIDGLRIDKAGAPAVVLRREADVWTMVEPERAAVDPRAARFALREIERIEFDDVPAGGRADWERLGVTDAEVVTLRIDTPVPVPALHLGPRRHLRVGDSPDVWRAHHIDHFTFARELRLWKEGSVP
jgi:hypothetical protein